MSKERIRELLEDYRKGIVSQDEILSFLEHLPFEDLRFAKIDHHRELRWGFPEVLFCQGKTSAQVRAIALKILERGSNLLATRMSRKMYGELREDFPGAQYNETGLTLSLVKKDIPMIPGRVHIVTAGTSDMPVAEEALETGRMLGLNISSIHDIGVAGIHRVMHYRKEIESAAVIIVIAGMEGALASVIAGLVSSPVIAVPTSIGYGASFQGIAPLLSMLNSCVPGIAVMNIDNGFGASFLAFRILKTAGRLSAEK